MRNRSVLALAFSFILVAIGTADLLAQAADPEPRNPEGNTGSLKAQVQTAGSYDAHSGNATRSITDLSVPGAVGDYGLDLVRYWNSLRNDRREANSTYEPDQRTDFGAPGWSHSWAWVATEARESPVVPDGEEEIYITSITITFPDGHANKYQISRGSRPHGEDWDPNPTCGPPYYAERGERDWQGPGGAVGDHLQGMDHWGTNFWLYRADGGAVHFEVVSGDYRATKVFDPHGLRTDLHYDADGLLEWVQQDGGRRLTFRWDSYCIGPGQCWSKVIGAVTREGSGGTQTVEYRYSRLDLLPPNGSWLTLTSVIYQNDPVYGEIEARYTYWGDYTPPEGFFFAGPLLATASDPRFDGPMKFIRYTYAGSGCRPQGQPEAGYPDGKLDYFYASPTGIKTERAGKTGTIVSEFVLGCFDGTRTEYNGFNAIRKFYYGRHPAGVAGGYGAMGHELTKLTDFYFYPQPSGLPFKRQNYKNGHPRESWDGRGILTEFIHTDGTGLPSEIKHIGSGDGSSYRYNRVDDGSSDDRDTTRVPNPGDRWLFSKTDELIQTTSYLRDSRRRIKKITHPDTSTEHFTYTHLNQVQTHTLASGAIKTYIYDTSDRLDLEYNSVDGPGEFTKYTYYGGPNNHPEWTDLVETVQNCRARNQGQPFSAKMEYNGRHQVTKVIYPAAAPGGNASFVQYGYDQHGNCISIRNELGHTSYYSYDPYGRCTSYTEPLNAPGWNGTGTVASRRWDWSYDRVIEKIDGSLSGTFGSLAHTSKEWSIQIEPAFSEAGERRVTARWFDVQNRITREQIGGISGSDTETHLFRYDQNGQKISFTDPRGRVTTYDYDLRNRLKRTIEPLNRITETTFDTAGNKTLVEFPDETTQQWPAYDSFGQPLQFIDERGNTTYLDYWPWGPMKILARVTTKRTRDDTQPEYQLTEFLPDQMGRPRRTNFPDGSFELADYGCGQIKTWTTRRSQIKRLFYDARGREDYHTWDNGAAAGIDRQWDDANRLTAISNSFSLIDYGYDDAGQAKWEGTTVAAGAGMVPSGRKEVKYCRYPSGEVSQLTYPDGNTVVNRYYTGRGQLSSVGWGWANGSTSYVYWPDGKVNYQARTNHVTTSFDYDGRGIMSLVKHRDDDTGHDLAKREYYWRDERDRITAWKRGTDNSLNAMEDGRGDRYHYDPEGQLDIADYRAEHPDTTANNPVRRDQFYYDELGNRMGWNRVASRGALLNFTRRDNGLNQYLNWTPSVIYYDDNHPNDPAYPPVWTFPANGVMMAEGWITASFNALNQPVAMWCPTYGSNFLWFGYDPLGRCVKRWMGTNMGVPVGVNPTTYFYYDGWNLVQEGTAPNSPTRHYVHGGRVDEIVASQADGQWYHHHYDGRGHCIMLTDANGGIREQYDYDAFGMPYFYNAAGTLLGASAQFGNRFLFTGREWLKDLRLYDFRHRQYQPELGRFLQPDPKQFEAGDYNLYRYCHNDPVNKSDPTGLDTYQQNREIDGSAVRSNYNPFTHSITFTTNPDGSIKNTYSWGNAANPRGWNANQPEDITAAEAAMASKEANKVGDSKLDPYVDKAFAQLNKKENEHMNPPTCKYEAQKLLKTAKELQKQDDAKVEKETNQSGKSIEKKED